MTDYSEVIKQKLPICELHPFVSPTIINTVYTAPPPNSLNLTLKLKKPLNSALTLSQAWTKSLRPFSTSIANLKNISFQVPLVPHKPQQFTSLVFAPDLNKNFQGTILGPRGQNLMQMQKFSQTQMNLRGQGSQRMQSGIVNPGDDLKLHVQIKGNALNSVIALKMVYDVYYNCMQPDALNRYKQIQLQQLSGKKIQAQQPWINMEKDHATMIQKTLQHQKNELKTHAKGVQFYETCLQKAKMQQNGNTDEKEETKEQQLNTKEEAKIEQNQIQEQKITTQIKNDYTELSEEEDLLPPGME
ncbi:Conserved_hypothetical protein [Hexamita inflata]|uniref:KHDC4/BBP-like KH-domain type I domain-containing protein n=1 Tax=Hexamita inflata TaxID=28002 RepID=A0AA86UBS2_9EUKA|nr:Conserved hypothetical protein [Hexamita inflata]